MTVCHKYNFVDPRTGAHTQTIEGLWQHVRALLPRHGMRPNKLHMYLDEFVYRRYNSNKGDGVLSDLINFCLGVNAKMGMILLMIPSWKMNIESIPKKYSHSPRDRRKSCTFGVCLFVSELWGRINNLILKNLIF